MANPAGQPAAGVEPAAPSSAPKPQAELEGGSYEVIRARLLAQAALLGAKADALNARRKLLFGGAELSVLGSERVRTENNCVPRDIVGVGKHLLFGYNVFLGLKTETAVADVFSLHGFGKTESGFDVAAVPHTEAAGFLADTRFLKDFRELYQYYKGARLLQLRRTETKLLAVFQTGDSVRDVKVLRWAIDVEGNATYVDNRGERDHVYPPMWDFEWTKTTREDFVGGRHPHVSILDTVFVEAVGGDLTVKVENNTETGQGIYSEPVDDPRQALDDAEILYAKLGTLIVLRIKPFREDKWRHLVFNTRSKKVVRVDAIGQACVQLPEDQGLIFPGGYYLQTGEYKLFDGEMEGLEFVRRVISPNGEDVLYVFHHRADGRYFLLPYNLVRKQVANPFAVHGYSLFPDGRMIVFKALSNEPTRVHPMQVWQTPFVSADHHAAAPTDGSFLSRIGNADLVRGVSEAYTVRQLAELSDATRGHYEDLIAATTRMVDAYHWLGNAEADLLGVVDEIRRTAELIVDEFEKVQALKRRAIEAVEAAASEQEALVRSLFPDDWKTTDEFIRALTALRTQRGKLIGVREVRYADLPRLEALEAEVVKAFDAISEKSVGFLLKGRAFDPLVADLDVLLKKSGEAKVTAEVVPLQKEVERLHEGLTVLGEVIANLQVADPNDRTKILQGISEVFAHLNRTRATVQGKRKELATREGKAEFVAQFALLGQSVESALSLCDVPERCDEQLSRLLVQVEELEGRFGEFEDHVAELERKREELHEAFGARRQSLLDERQRRARSLFETAERILGGITRRAKSFKDEAELNAYFAADAMVAKLRGIGEQLAAVGDSVKADEAQTRLKAARQEAVRGLRDRRDLIEEGTNLVKLGRHKFTVGAGAVELTVVPRDGALALHLTGTDFHEPLDAAVFGDTKDLWEQTLVSETPDVYRGEYLAATILADAEEGRGAHTLAGLAQAALSKDGLLGIVRDAMGERYDEGYERGIHDVDAAAILEKVLSLRAGAGLLRYAPTPRAWACLYWALQQDMAARELLERKGRSFGRLRDAFVHTSAFIAFADGLAARIAAFLGEAGIEHATADTRAAGRYLAEELANGGAAFALGSDAAGLRDAFLTGLEEKNGRVSFEEDLRALEGNLRERFLLAKAWLTAWVDATPAAAPRARCIDEAVVLLLTGRELPREASTSLSGATVKGLLGQHPRVVHGEIAIELDELGSRLGAYIAERAPRFRAWRKRVRELLDGERKRLKLHDLVPQVLTTFVRNRLIDEVYLPLLGDNLAKQLGAAGEGKRTDRMGMLLLISPPGYGKTTLMEYVCSRLGLVFMKINGPALGHDVTSLDPADAPNATARQEVERINLAFEMGNNVMLYLDDIQHTSPELLQKFISLCDGQRKIEGVWRGQTKTYDLRGKKFCVAMAGNPYTESGERFRVPDMLANRADTYNLGDILEGKSDVFALSYVENALTSNPVLAPLAARDPADVHQLIRMARGGDVNTATLKHGYSSVELQEIVAVLQRLLKVQETVLKVNLQYIASASQDERFRTEPAFKLQGSYRNMSKLAARVVAAMNEAELQRLIDDHYAGEAQTLTNGAEHNLLKLAEMLGRQTPEQKARWEEIKKSFARAKLLGGKEDDPVARVTAQLSGLGSQLETIGDAIRGATPAKGAAEKAAPPATATLASPELMGTLRELREAVLQVARATADAGAKVPATPVLPSAPATDLAPFLEKLEQTLKAVAEKSGPRPKVGGVRPPPDWARQVELIEAALSPLRELAARQLQSGDESLKAMGVWKGVNEALELLRAVRPATAPASRNQK